MPRPEREADGDELVTLQLRKITTTGDSLALTLPIRDIAAEFDIEAADLEGEIVQIRVDQSGEFSSSLPVSDD